MSGRLGAQDLPLRADPGAGHDSQDDALEPEEMRAWPPFMNRMLSGPFDAYVTPRHETVTLR